MTQPLYPGQIPVFDEPGDNLGDLPADHDELHLQLSRELGAALTEYGTDPRGNDPDVADRLARIDRRVGCWVRRVDTGPQAIDPDTPTLISWNSGIIDTDGFITVQSDTITVPNTQPGIYIATVTLTYTVPVPISHVAVLVAAGTSSEMIFKRERGSTGAAAQSEVVSLAWLLAAQDTVQVEVEHAGASATNIFGDIQMWRLAGELG